MTESAPTQSDLRTRNPFRDALVTELIEDIDLYRDMFSDSILVGQACNVFQPGNVVVLGPQGSGKTMILNLTRLPVLAKWLRLKRKTPQIVDQVPPFFGISANLARLSFHTFGNRSVSKALGLDSVDPILETSAAGDFLAHFLFNEFIKGVRLIREPNNHEIREWLGIQLESIDVKKFIGLVKKWPCWKGYYSDCTTWEALQRKCNRRQQVWREFLIANIDQIPKTIWQSKVEVQAVMHHIGNFLRRLGKSKRPLSLLVYIDQYEVLKELNPTHASELQRLLNTLIKARDPVVFYRIGARTYDWGQELRVLGAESRIEFQRDYVIVDLNDLLIRNEDRLGYIFTEFAVDVACRRLKSLEKFDTSKPKLKNMFGRWAAVEEAQLYFRTKARASVTIKKVPPAIKTAIIDVCKSESPLDLRLASAWALQKLQRGLSESELLNAVKEKPWFHKWWFKERKEIALLQVASHANQKRRYYGWDSLIYLSGGNISAFLMLCSEIWDVATKQDINPLTDVPLDAKIQTDGIMRASRKWRERDRTESAGSERYIVVNRLGAAIANSIQTDLALSNPGHTGFSIREADLYRNEEGNRIRTFLQNAVSWAIFEERRHKSKHRGDTSRVKFYLHPLLSPSFNIPIKRVKEPYYTTIREVFSWLFLDEPVGFGTHKRRH